MLGWSFVTIKYFQLLTMQSDLAYRKLSDWSSGHVADQWSIQYFDLTGSFHPNFTIAFRSIVDRNHIFMCINSLHSISFNSLSFRIRHIYATFFTTIFYYLFNVKHANRTNIIPFGIFLNTNKSFIEIYKVLNMMNVL